MSELNQRTTETASTEAQLVHALVHFWRVVRYRQVVVVSSLVVACMLGGLYYATAKRRYQAKAALLVLQSGPEVVNSTTMASDMRQGLMPTYEKLFSSAVVIDKAIQSLPPNQLQDLKSVHRDKWVQAVRDRMSAVTMRQTNIIEVSYRSEHAAATVSMVNALLKAYVDFINSTQKGTAGQIVNVLTQEKVQLEAKLTAKEAEVLQARKQFGDLGIRNGGDVVHPLVQRAIGLNEALLKAQQKRLELQASLQSVQHAVKNKEDLQQHLMTLENSLGREFFLTGLGFSTRDTELQAHLEKSMLADKAELRTLQEYFGPAHPRVLEVQQRIQQTELYLSNFHVKAEERLAEVRDKQLGPLLQQMVSQRLGEAWQHETALRNNFEQSRVEAVNLNGDMARLEILEHDLKRMRNLHDVLLNQIANVDLKQDHGEIRTAIVSEPALPKSPLWPSLPTIGLGSLAAGLVIGLGLVYALDVLDDRFRSPEEMQAQLGTRVLAMVRQMEDLNTLGIDGIKMHVDPDSVETEAFRTLRTTLALSGHESARLVICSAEPGDGKTTVVANLGVAFVQIGKRTLLIDADMRRPGLTGLMGAKGQPGLSDVLVGSEPTGELAARLTRTTGLDGFDFLPAGTRRPNPAELLTGPRLAEVLAWAETQYDQIIVDSPPVLAASDASIIGRLVDGLVLVVQPKKNRRRLVVHAAETFQGGSINLFGVVVNRIGDDSIYGADSGYGYGYGYGYGNGYGEAEEEANESDEMAVPTRAA